MDPIPNINIQVRNIDIPPTQIWDVNVPSTIPRVIPVTTQIGTPIVNMPGCVTAHEKSDKNDTIVSDDPKGAKIFCDGSVPSFSPIQYEPENMTFEQSAPIPKLPGAPDAPAPKTPEIPKTDPVTAVTEETVEEVPDVDWVEEYLPPASTVTTTAAIAVVATTSALLAKPLADILLKLIKPTIKKVLTKVQKMIGKKIKVYSLRERRGQQRSRNKAVRVLKGRE